VLTHLRKPLRSSHFNAASVGTSKGFEAANRLQAAKQQGLSHRTGYDDVQSQ
jgi:hypothetical protein